MKLLRRKTSKL